MVFRDSANALTRQEGIQVRSIFLARIADASFPSGMSDWQESAIKRKDFRATKAPEPEPPKPTRGKKDRKRWCGGHEGREHKLECRIYKGWLGTKGWRERICTTCGKQADWWSGPSGFGRKKKPSWVTL